jgi:hypothetical protein
MRSDQLDRRALLLGGFGATTLALAQTGDVAMNHRITAHNVAAEPGEFLGHKALRLVEEPGKESESEDKLAIVDGVEFGNGTIELEIASRPKQGSGQGARGFAGIAFHVAADRSKFECFYLRPTNGRADDQERRNHAVQYISFPDHPWHKLRRETPSRYESYADLQPSVWMPVRLEVEGVKARLYVLGATQPTLLVNDLKLGATRGGIAFWIGPGTEAFFRGLKVTPA